MNQTKKGEKKKLIIKKETVRELNNDDLKDVAGGMLLRDGNNTMQNGCEYRSAAYAC
jgi:hypothetical protein